MIKKSKACLTCGLEFKYFHSIRLVCEKCYFKTPRGEEERRRAATKYQKTLGYKKSLAKSRLKTALKILEDKK